MKYVKFFATIAAQAFAAIFVIGLFFWGFVGLIEATRAANNAIKIAVLAGSIALPFAAIVTLIFWSEGRE